MYQCETRGRALRLRLVQAKRDYQLAAGNWQLAPLQLDTGLRVSRFQVSGFSVSRCRFAPTGFSIDNFEIFVLYAPCPMLISTDTFVLALCYARPAFSNNCIFWLGVSG